VTTQHTIRKAAALMTLTTLASVLLAAGSTAGEPTVVETAHRLYVAEPGIRNYLEYGGHGLLVYDIDHGHRFIKRIPTAGLDAQGKPINVKGICANARTGRLYISTIKQLMCLDLVSEKLLWERTYEAGCDRMAITPDGRTIFLPSFEGPLWYVVRADEGKVIARVEPRSGSHNTIVGPDGKRAYLAGLNSPNLTIVDTGTNKVIGSCGPFSASIRPFTINGAQTLCFVNVNRLLGFEVGDLVTGQKLYRVEVAGFQQGPTKRHGCPSHGIGLTPDGRELWLTDAFNRQMHIFDATVMPPKQIGQVALRDEPGWITFGIDGRYAYPSTGDVISVLTRKIIGRLKDEAGRDVQSEKMLEVEFRGGEPARAGDQFGIGQPDAIR
jgi:DNA-binding beta-propeller fold protein YncE